MNQAEAKALLSRMRDLRRQVQEDGEALYQSWKGDITRPTFHISARNLADYMALRRHDLRELPVDGRRVGALGVLRHAGSPSR